MAHEHRQRVAEVIFKTRVRDTSLNSDNPFRWKDLSTSELFGNRRLAVLALPGAFTPTCSSTHLPDFEARYDELRKLGVDEVVCVSVNDAFTMYRWAQHLGVSKVFMLPDGNGEFTRKMGMLVDKSNLGFGYRSWRYSMVVTDGEIEKMWVEPGLRDNADTDPFEVSDVGTMLEYLRGR